MTPRLHASRDPRTQWAGSIGEETPPASLGRYLQQLSFVAVGLLVLFLCDLFVNNIREPLPPEPLVIRVPFYATMDPCAVASQMDAMLQPFVFDTGTRDLAPAVPPICP